MIFNRQKRSVYQHTAFETLKPLPLKLLKVSVKILLFEICTKNWINVFSWNYWDFLSAPREAFKTFENPPRTTFVRLKTFPRNVCNLRSFSACLCPLIIEETVAKTSEIIGMWTCETQFVQGSNSTLVEDEQEEKDTKSFETAASDWSPSWKVSK